MKRRKTRRVLSDKFVFDTEIIVQALIHHFKIEEIPIQARYFDEASKIRFEHNLDHV